MDNQEWHDRWADNRIGFHQAETNPYLAPFWPALEQGPGDRVFVPLCGKSLDMLWLADQGHEVFGIEISAIAVEAFFTENRLDYERETRRRFGVFRSVELEVWCGDFFDLAPEDLAGVSAVFDRGSLVAFPADLRETYARHLQRVLPRNAPMLLVTLEYPQHEMQGPPFSAPTAEVNRLFGDRYRVELLESQEILDKEPHFQKKGLSTLTERIYHLHAA